MTDILIRTKKEKIEHKMISKIGPWGHCWWTGVYPRKEVKNVLFTDGKRIIAEGEAIGLDPTKKAIVFHPLKKVDKPLPKKVPTRGFTYVE
jgi:hypothetical protein